MTILKIAQLGHPVLREKAQPIHPEEINRPNFQRLIQNMFATLNDSNRPGWNSVGLAGNQVYTPKRVFILDFKLDDHHHSKNNSERVRQVFINPKILEKSQETERDFESCLSLTDISGIVKRPRSVKVQALNRKGQEFTLSAEGFYARLIQHEIDHLDGILFVDRMQDMHSLTFSENLHRQYRLQF